MGVERTRIDLECVLPQRVCKVTRPSFRSFSRKTEHESLALPSPQSLADAQPIPTPDVRQAFALELSSSKTEPPDKTDWARIRIYVALQLPARNPSESGGQPISADG